MTSGDLTLVATDVSTISEVRWRQRVRVRGTVRKLRIQPWGSGIVTLECQLVDDTGGLLAVFLGRRRVAGIQLGRSLELEGTVIESHGRLAIMNPEYTFLPED
jgi:hypothetical protein